MSENEYDNLNKTQKEQIQKNVSEIRSKAVDALRKLKTAEKESEQKIDRIDNEIGSFILEDLFLEFKKKYDTNNSVLKYFKYVTEDILRNLSVFVGGINKRSMTKEEEEFLLKYKVNLIIDNSDMEGGPVICELNPTYSNLVGSVEYESKLGTLTTDFLKIRAGSILKANGGYLILNAEDVLRNYQSWEALKRVLRSGEIMIEGIRSQLELLTISNIKPEKIPVSIKVVLIGTDYLYQMLYELDDEFSELFKVKAHFDSIMERDEKNIEGTVKFISSYCSKNNIRHLDNTGVAALLHYSSRLSESRRKLTSHLHEIVNILNESNMWAEVSESKYINMSHVKKAVTEKKKRINLIEEKMLEMYRDKKIIIDVNNRVAGQINGLSVIEIGGYAFGKPCRITATTYMGKSGIINIEREAQLSGNIHNKSVMIISGYLGEMYAKNVPISLTANICFEQLYGLIEGDSASIAELYVILSSISGIPMKQSIAVTGSLNQKGEVQPVGGINEKIEGFYRVCSLYGLNKEQGVIIPYSNIDDIMLDDDIMRDIKDGLFHIYAINNVEEGIEILTDMKAGTREGGSYPESSFNYHVDRKLKEYIKNYSIMDELKHEDTGKAGTGNKTNS